MRPKIREEQETIVIFNRASDLAKLWTADALQARRWRKAGYPVTVKGGGWEALVSKWLVTFRKVRLHKADPSAVTPSIRPVAECERAAPSIATPVKTAA